MAVTVLKSYLEKKHRKIISYRDLGKFSMILELKFCEILKRLKKKLACNRQRNYCVPLKRKSKRDYYNNLDNRNVTDRGFADSTFHKSALVDIALTFIFIFINLVVYSYLHISQLFLTL